MESLDSTAWSMALRESLYVYPLIESTHVIVLMLTLGTLFIVNLRLLGVAFRYTPVSQVSSTLLPWTIAGLVISVTTGLLLFYAIRSRLSQHLVSRETPTDCDRGIQRLGFLQETQPKPRAMGPQPETTPCCQSEFRHFNHDVARRHRDRQDD